MNKKGSIKIFVIISFILIVIISISILVFIFLQKKESSKQEEFHTIPLFIAPRILPSENLTKAQYVLEYFDKDGNNIVYSKGNLEDSWNELNVPSDYPLIFYCWSDSNYLVKAVKIISSEEVAKNKSTFVCDMVKIGNLSASYSGEIDSTINIGYLNISTQDWFYRTGICFAWSGGLIDVALKEQYISCDKGIWKNYSGYNSTTDEFIYLKNSTYLCGEDYYEKCSYIEGNKCKAENMEIPSRFSNKVDSCIYTGKTLHNSSQIFEIEVRSMEFKNRLDYFDVFIFDSDRRKNTLTNEWEWVNEYEGNDIGSTDKIIRVYHDKNCYNEVCE